LLYFLRDGAKSFLVNYFHSIKLRSAAQEAHKPKAKAPELAFIEGKQPSTYKAPG